MRSALLKSGFALPEAQVVALEKFVGLVRGASERVSLVSAGDLAVLEEKHVVDSLGLVPVLREVSAGGAVHVDIGSGGGFPGIVLAVVFPEREVVLVERSEKKAAFLKEIVAALGLGNTRVVCGEFPGAVKGLEGVGSVTARAVERPERIWPRVLKWLPEGAVFLCQFSGDAPKLPEGVGKVAVPEETAAGVRGRLRVYRRGD